ncbi:MAG: type I glyceraldehyde-3-phosphate dehydrogenase [Candidatus Falkowbacteria bacterium]
MPINIAINGFGRIGRLVFKKIIENHPDLEVMAINDLTDNKTLAHLLKYDSIYGIYGKEVNSDKESISVDGKKFKVFEEEDPENLPWKDLGVDIVLECTGYFRDLESAGKHIKAGAKKVIISAPAKEGEARHGRPAKDKEIPGFVLGVNAQDFNSKKHDIMDMGSCTTNCLAPIAKILNDEFKIETGFMTTVHSYTNDQRLLDLPHKDLRRARAAAMNIVPTSTGAAKAIGKIIPELNGKLDGIALRIPTSIVSVLDLVVKVKKSTTTEEVNKVFEKASKTKELQGIFTVEKKPLVSTDFIANSYSSIVDSELTDVHDTLIKVIAWYDNEMGYSTRMAEFTEFIGKKM